MEQFGTFPLPHSQLDRFTIKMSIGYPSPDAEREILRIGDIRDRLQEIEPVVGRGEVLRAIREIEDVHVSDKIINYVLCIVEKTRRNGYLLSGLSTRGALVLLGVAKTNAYLHRRDYVIPEDIKELIPYVVPHRVVFKEEYEHLDREGLVLSLLEEVRTPA
jgi:MoxR-like ATPase